MPEPKLHEAVSPKLKQQYPVATSGFDSQEPTLTMTPMGLSANPELSNWDEQFLDPTMTAYFETHKELNWVSFTLRIQHRPNPLIVVGAEDEKQAGWSDFQRVIERELRFAPCEVDLLIEPQVLQDLSAAVHNSNQAVQEEKSRTFQRSEANRAFPRPR